MKKSKTQKGITLVALIITIIILLILAVVSIRAVQGDGIIEYAKNASNAYEYAKKKEEQQLKNYMSILNEEGEEITGNAPTVDELEQAHEFEYYSSLSRAVNDLNGVADNEPDTNKGADNCVAGVYIDENNKPVVVLLKDTTETERLLFSTDATLNLGGNVLTSSASAAIDGTSNNTDTIIIDGRLKDSGIKVENEDKAVIFQSRAKNTFIINGGTYEVEAPTETRGITVSGKATFSNCTLNACSDGVSQGIAIANGGEVEVTNSNIVADAPGALTDGGIYAVGIGNKGTLIFNSGSVTGTYSGILTSSKSKTYVYGGTFSSCYYGGFVFNHGADGEAYIENATINCTEYDGIYKDVMGTEITAPESGFFVRNASIANMNNCTIRGGKYAFILKAAGSTLKISNSTIGDNYDEAKPPINIMDAKSILNIGTGCNFDDKKTTLPDSVIKTEEVYTNQNN